MVWTRWKPECGHGKCQADVLQIATMYAIIIISVVTILNITMKNVIFMVSNFINYLIIVIIINLRAMLAMQ